MLIMVLDFTFYDNKNKRIFQIHNHIPRFNALILANTTYYLH